MKNKKQTKKECQCWWEEKYPCSTCKEKGKKIQECKWCKKLGMLCAEHSNMCGCGDPIVVKCVIHGDKQEACPEHEGRGCIYCAERNMNKGADSFWTNAKKNWEEKKEDTANYLMDKYLGKKVPDLVMEKEKTYEARYLFGQRELDKDHEKIVKEARKEVLEEVEKIMSDEGTRLNIQKIYFIYEHDWNKLKKRLMG